MSKFDLTFCKVYIYARGWPGINLGASHESCTHSTKYLHSKSILIVIYLTHITEVKSDPVKAPQDDILEGRNSSWRIVSVFGSQPLLHTLDFVP